MVSQAESNKRSYVKHKEKRNEKSLEYYYAHKEELLEKARMKREAEREEKKRNGTYTPRGLHKRTPKSESNEKKKYYVPRRSCNKKYKYGMVSVTVRPDDFTVYEYIFKLTERKILTSRDTSKMKKILESKIMKTTSAKNLIIVEDNYIQVYMPNQDNKKEIAEAIDELVNNEYKTINYE